MSGMAPTADYSAKKGNLDTKKSPTALSEAHDKLSQPIHAWYHCLFTLWLQYPADRDESLMFLHFMARMASADWMTLVGLGYLV